MPSLLQFIVAHWHCVVMSPSGTEGGGCSHARSYTERGRFWFMMMVTSMAVHASQVLVTSLLR